MWVAKEIELRSDSFEASNQKEGRLTCEWFLFCVLQSAGFAGQVLQVDPISVIANNYNIYELSWQKDFGSTRKKDQEETEDTDTTIQT